MKQFERIANDIFKEPLSEREEKAVKYSKDLRQITSMLANTYAWWHLIKRINNKNNVITNLKCWVELMAKVGGGTGKQVPLYLSQARVCMIEGRNAVPVWIMPVKTALETFDPVKNHFDIGITCFV